MKISELTNHHHSYHVIVTFDIVSNKDTSVYEKIRVAFEEKLELTNCTYSSKSDGEKEITLPNNTFATIYHKDDKASELKNYFLKEIEKIFNSLGIKARLFVAIADNWSVGSKNID